MSSSEMYVYDILPQKQPKRKLRTAIEATPSGQLLVVNDTPLSNVDCGQKLTFIPVEEHYIGRRDTTSGIKFGKISTGKADMPVAIKPHCNTASALSEFCITQQLTSEGRIKPYQPLGFLSDRSSIHTISMFESDVVSCDTITNRTDDPEKIQRVLLIGATTLANLHKSGVAHGDAQIKNTAFHTKTGDVRAIDLTFSYFDKSCRGIIDDMGWYIGTLPDYITSMPSSECIKTYFLTHTYRWLLVRYQKNNKIIYTVSLMICWQICKRLERYLPILTRLDIRIRSPIIWRSYSLTSQT